jgi:hypothetical protein
MLQLVHDSLSLDTSVCTLWQNGCMEHIRVGLNTPQIKLLAIWVGGMHCVIVKKLCGAHFFGVVGLNMPPKNLGAIK